MSADRELLELAAKAAGSEIWTDADGNIYTGEPERLWNPLTDDGDALRLAGALRIDIEWWSSGWVRAIQCSKPGQGLSAVESVREHREANTRRAIVRAAAEIGRSLP